MWVSKRKSISVHFGFIHNVIWRVLLHDLIVGKCFFVQGKHLCVKL